MLRIFSRYPHNITQDFACCRSTPAFTVWRYLEKILKKWLILLAKTNIYIKINRFSLKKRQLVKNFFEIWPKWSPRVPILLNQIELIPVLASTDIPYFFSHFSTSAFTSSWINIDSISKMLENFLNKLAILFAKSTDLDEIYTLSK